MVGNEKGLPPKSLQPFVLIGLPRGIRTPDRRLRRPMLYPTELWADAAQCVAQAGTLKLRLPGAGGRRFYQMDGGRPSGVCSAA